MKTQDKNAQGGNAASSVVSTSSLDETSRLNFFDKKPVLGFKAKKRAPMDDLDVPSFFRSDINHLKRIIDDNQKKIPMTRLSEKEVKK